MRSYRLLKKTTKKKEKTEVLTRVGDVQATRTATVLNGVCLFSLTCRCARGKREIESIPTCRTIVCRWTIGVRHRVVNEKDIVRPQTEKQHRQSLGNRLERKYWHIKESCCWLSNEREDWQRKMRCVSYPCQLATNSSSLDECLETHQGDKHWFFRTMSRVLSWLPSNGNRSEKGQVNSNSFQVWSCRSISLARVNQKPMSNLLR